MQDQDQKPSVSFVNKVTAPRTLGETPNRSNFWEGPFYADPDGLGIVIVGRTGLEKLVPWANVADVTYPFEVRDPLDDEEEIPADDTAEIEEAVRAEEIAAECAD